MAGEILNASDWSTDASWSSLLKPADGDDAIIPNTLGSDVTMSGDEGGVDLGYCYVHPLYRHRCGTAASPLHIAAALIEVLGSTGFYLESDDNGAAGDTVEFIRLQMREANTPVELGSHAGALDGDFERILVQRGHVTLKAGTKFTASSKLEIGYMADRLNDARVILAAGAELLPTLVMNGGQMQCDSAITSAWLHAGTLKQDTAAISVAHIHPGATLEYNGTATLGECDVYDDGVLDLEQTAVRKTITTLRVWPRGRVIGRLKRLWDVSGTKDGMHTVTNYYDMGAMPK